MDDDAAGWGETDRRSGPRTSVVLALTLGALVALVAVAIGVTTWMDRSSDSDEAAPATTGDGSIDVEPVGAGSANRLFARRTEAGIDIRVHETDDPMFAGGPMMDDDAPDSCRMRSMAMVTAVAPDAVAQTQLPLAVEVPEEAAVSPLVGGQIEGAPLYGVVAQVDDNVTMARLTVIGGGQDSMEPVEGVVALAVSSAPAPEVVVDDTVSGRGPPFGDPWGQAMQTMALELLRADGSTERITGDDLMRGLRQPRIWSEECMGEEFFIEESVPPASTAPLTVPDPGGQQPADPAAAQAQITQAFTDLYADIGNFETLLRTVDDPSGIDLLVADAPGPVARRIRGTTVAITDLVFFSPIEASFVYRATVPGNEGDATWYGRARLIEGSWRITRSTICQDLERAGLVCQV